MDLSTANKLLQPPNFAYKDTKFGAISVAVSSSLIPFEIMREAWICLRVLRLLQDLNIEDMKFVVEW